MNDDDSSIYRNTDFRQSQVFYGVVVHFVRILSALIQHPVHLFAVARRDVSERHLREVKIDSE